MQSNAIASSSTSTSPVGNTDNVPGPNGGRPNFGAHEPNARSAGNDGYGAGAPEELYYRTFRDEEEDLPGIMTLVEQELSEP
jgi:hypothetical protein